MAFDRNALGVESIRLEIARIAPELGHEPVTPLGEGMDNLAICVGETFVFRFPKHAEAAAGLRREMAILPRLAPTLAINIPRFEHVGVHSSTGLPFAGYRMIRGAPLHGTLYNELPAAVQDGVCGELAAFLEAVHSFPASEAMDLGVAPHGTRAHYIEELGIARDGVFPRLPEPVRRVIEARLDAFLEDDANFTYTPTLLHGDLWPEHVLFSLTENRLAGVIDFGDVCLGDPDYDLAFLYLRLGAGLLERLLRYHRHADTARLVKKVPCLALLNAIDDVSIGLERGDGHLVDSGLVDVIELSGCDQRGGS